MIGYAPSARDEALRQHWSPDGKPIVGFVGRLAPEKHVERLADWRPAAPCRWSSSATASTERKLQSAMPTAVFTGALYGEELAAAYASMDVFVHAGEHETFCQVVQEALASGLPVIAPDAGGPRDLVTPWRTGLLLRVNEFEAQLPDAVAHLLEERQRYRMAARRSVLGPQLAGHLRRAARPLRGGAVAVSPGQRAHVAQATRVSAFSVSPAPTRRPAATVPRCVAGSRSRPWPVASGAAPKNTRSGGSSASTTFSSAAAEASGLPGAAHRVLRSASTAARTSS